MRDVKTVVDELNGMTTDEVVRTIRNAGIKALPGAYEHCALAVYIRQETGARVGVVSFVQVLNSYPETDGPAFKISPALNEFIDDFDQYTYPDLILNEYREAWDI